ncbi:unnamed protein product [Penicillium olsonii]|nr:unnamed protein product [Penicillium olsonii]
MFLSAIWLYSSFILVLTARAGTLAPNRTSLLSPTQHTGTMKGTSIFQFKSWPKIHQPLPRTPRESQQLLNALTSSFRRQLDGAYPASGNPARPLPNPESSAHATDQHLQTILKNPLFRIVPSGSSGHEQSTLQRVEDQRKLVEQPMAVMDQMAAAGSLTATTIRDCLRYQLLLSRSPDQMKASRAASRVVDWYWASDGASRLSLLRLRSATSALAKFMVMEGMHGTMMEWLRMIMNHDLGSQDGHMADGIARQTFSHLLVDFIDAEACYGNGFDSAITHYLNVCQMHFQSTSVKSRNPMLLAAAAHLNRISIANKPTDAQRSAEVNDQFREMVSLLAPRSLLLASVAICHPVHPDPSVFVHFVAKLSPSAFQKWNKARRDAFFEIGSEALRVLVEQDKFRDIYKLEHCISNLLPAEMPTLATETSHTSTEEEHLARLNLGLT